MITYRTVKAKAFNSLLCNTFKSSAIKSLASLQCMQSLSIRKSHTQAMKSRHSFQTSTLRLLHYNQYLFSNQKKNKGNQQTDTRILTLRQKLHQYNLLCRNDKPIGYMLLYWPTAWGVLIGSITAGATFTTTSYLLALFFMGSLTSRSAGCIVNDMLDRQFDKKVERTKSRPLAAGTVTMKQAGGLLFLNLCGGLIVLFHLPFHALIFTMGIVALAGLYPLAKRYTHYPQVVLGIGFNSGVIIAALTVNPVISFSYIIPHYIAGICWTLIYDTAYAFQDIQDDLNIGVKSTAIAWKDKNPLKIMQKLGWCIIGLHALLPIIDLNLWLTSGLLIMCDFKLIRTLRELDLNNRAACGHFFKFNNYYGLAIFGALALGGIYYQSQQQIQQAQKKDPKKDVPEPPKQEEVPVIPPHELQGFGRFQYLDGTVYEGNWHLFDGIKKKHGQGVLKIPGTSNGNLGYEQYQGSWHQDQMSGYGVYQYANGAVYKGEWKNNKHHGKGQYEFPDGTCYQGDWQSHLMNGAGIYIDGNGRKWEGEFRKGKYESKMQKQLAKQRQLVLRKAAIIKQIEEVINKMLEALAKSDKKTLKENFSPFFAAGEVVKEQLKDPYCKFDEKPQDKWTQILTILKSAKINPLASAEEAVFIAAERILKPQLEGPGQVVEIISTKDDKTIKAGFVNVQGSIWILASIAQ